MEVKVINQDTAIQSSTMQLSEAVYGCKFNEGLVHQVITAYLAAARQGSKAQKSRSEVRGGGIKPWRQKGTGRARAGTINSPIWRSGGVTFAAKPRSYVQKLNKKMYRSALRSILSELLRQDSLLVVDDFKIETPKTQQLLKKLQKLNLENVLIVADEINNNLFLASRNLHQIEVSDVVGVNPVSLVKHNKILMTVNVLKKLEELLG